jgi:glycosyltransferase involved in cell wall biosynthesis
MGKRLIWHVREFGWEDYRIKYNFGYKYFQYWFNKADAVISISKAIYEKRVLNHNLKQTAIVYNGVISKKELQQNKQNQLLSNNNRQHKGIVFAIVGHISPEKGQEEAISAFLMLLDKAPDAKLLIVGSGEEEFVTKLMNHVEDNHLRDKIVFTGYIENVKDVYTSINCLLMCSKHEALGRVTIEAMSYGIPVIGYNGGGTVEIIKDGYNGLLYSKGHKELYEKMLVFMLEGEDANNYSKHAFDTVENYTIEKCVTSIYNIYSKV